MVAWPSPRRSFSFLSAVETCSWPRTLPKLNSRVRFPSSLHGYRGGCGVTTTRRRIFLYRGWTVTPRDAGLNSLAGSGLRSPPASRQFSSSPKYREQTPVSGTPISVRSPRSPKLRPDPTTTSRTLLDTPIDSRLRAGVTGRPAASRATAVAPLRARRSPAGRPRRDMDRASA